MVSDLQQLGKAQLLMSFKDDPRCDGAAIIKEVLRAGKIERPDDFMAKEQQPDPLVLAKIAETESKVATERSTQIKNYAQSVLYLAQAEKIDTDQDMSFITGQLEVLRARMEGVNGTIKSRSGDPALGSDEEAAPIEGARKAKDGLWYLEDPERPGKFVQVMADAAAA